MNVGSHFLYTIHYCTIWHISTQLKFIFSFWGQFYLGIFTGNFTLFSEPCFTLIPNFTEASLITYWHDILFGLLLIRYFVLVGGGGEVSVTAMQISPLSQLFSVLHKGCWVHQLTQWFKMAILIWISYLLLIPEVLIWECSMSSLAF